jgi:ankyrin repeat protein
VKNRIQKATMVSLLALMALLIVLSRNPRIPFSYSTIIQKASACGFYRIVAIQLALGVEPDGPDRTPLIETILFDRPAVAELLVSHGASLDRQFASGEPNGPPLAWALIRGRREIAKTLLQHGARADYRPQYGSNNALQMGVRLGDIELVRLLLKNGANPNGYPHSGDAPLDLAATERRRDIAGILIRAGARPSGNAGHAPITPKK